MATALFLSTTILVSLLIICLTINAFVQSRTKNKYAQNEYPLSISYAKGLAFLCFGLFIPKLAEAFHSYLNITAQNINTESLLVSQLSYFSLYLGITVLAYIICMILSILTFGLISKGQKLFLELANNNNSALILFAGLFLAFTISTQSVLMSVLEYFIPYPSFPTFN